MRIAACFLIAAALVPGVAVADPTAASDSRPRTGETSAQVAGAGEDESEANYWERGDSRVFASSWTMLGIYSETQLNLGYGKPFWTWGGLSGGVMGYPGMFAAAIGPRFEFGLANLSFRYRQTWTSSYYGVRAANYDASSFLDAEEPKANYSSLDVDLWGVIPAGSTLGSWALRTVWVPDIQEDQALISQMQRYVLEGAPGYMPQLIWWVLLMDGDLSVGPALDAVLTAGRAPLIRAGGSMIYEFGPHLSVEVMLTMPVSSPDNFGIADEVWGNVDVGWAFATGEEEPGFL